MKNKERKTKNQEHGFTLIELLVVLSVMAILLAIALPNFLGIKEKAKQRKAIVAAKYLELAFNEYYNQNQSWPPSDSGDQVKGVMLSVLSGATGGVAFIEIGTNSVDTFFDPWGNYYQVAFDSDFDNKVTPLEGAPPGVTLSKSVIVWSVATLPSGVTVTNKSWE